MHDWSPGPQGQGRGIRLSQDRNIFLGCLRRVQTTKGRDRHLFFKNWDQGIERH
jgi:hypothetical protein